MLFFVFFVAGKKNLAILKPWFSILGFQMKCFFWGGRDVDPKSLLQNATQKEEEDHRNHGTKPGSIERGRLRRVLEQSGNHGFVSAGRVERDGEENRRRVVRRDGVRDRAARRDGDVRGFVCRRRRRLVLCVFFRVLVVLFFFMRARSPRSRVASSRCLFCHSLLSFRRDVYRRDGKRESKTVPECAIASLSLTSWLESQESDRKHLSLSFFLSNRYAANYKEQEKLDHRF